jgi:Family of unknown function (DUF5662)
MKRHLQYLSYIVRHKWFVLQASITIGAPLWQALVHDLSKLWPSEWLAYLAMFYGTLGDEQENMDIDRAFDVAWLKHQHRNPHHWQHWVLRDDGGELKVLLMPRRYILEMIADWAGAGRAITGKWECAEWYHKSKKLMQFHPETRFNVEYLLAKHFGYFGDPR